MPVRVATPRSPLASLVLVSSAFAALTLAAAAFADAPNVHAIVGARIVQAPGRVIERGTVVMRDGIIVAVGEKVSVPADARVWPGDSLTVYPGLIDPFVTPAEARRRPRRRRIVRRRVGVPPTRGAARLLSTVTPEARVVESLPLASDQLEGLRAAGFATAQVAPRRGIVRGNTAVIGLGDAGPNESVLAPDAAQVISLESAPDGYPGSLMGAIALIRQTLMDARWYRDVWASYTKSPVGKPRPETNVSWASLAPVVAGTQPVVMVADEMLEVLRSAAIAKEAGIRAYVVTAGDEYKRVKEIAATGMSLVVPVAFPEAPDVADDAAALEVATETLRYWNEAPGNPASARARQRHVRAHEPGAQGSEDIPRQRRQGDRARSARRQGARGGDHGAGADPRPFEPARHDRDRQDREPHRDPWRAVLGQGQGARGVGRRRALRGQQGRRRPGGQLAGRLRPASLSDDRQDRQGHDRAHRRRLGHAQGLERAARWPARALLGRAERRPDRASFDITAKNDVLSGTISVPPHSHDVVGSRVVEPDKDKKSGGDTIANKEVIPSPAVMGNSEPWRMPAPDRPAAVLVRNATVWTVGPQGTLQES